MTNHVIVEKIHYICNYYRCEIETLLHKLLTINIKGLIATIFTRNIRPHTYDRNNKYTY